MNKDRLVFVNPDGNYMLCKKLPRPVIVSPSGTQYIVQRLTENNAHKVTGFAIFTTRHNTTVNVCKVAQHHIPKNIAIDCEALNGSRSTYSTFRAWGASDTWHHLFIFNQTLLIFEETDLDLNQFVHRDKKTT